MSESCIITKEVIDKIVTHISKLPLSAIENGFLTWEPLVLCGECKKWFTTECRFFKSTVYMMPITTTVATLATPADFFCKDGVKA